MWKSFWLSVASLWITSRSTGGCSGSPRELIDAARPSRHLAGDRWFVDEPEGRRELGISVSGRSTSTNDPPAQRSARGWRLQLRHCPMARLHVLDPPGAVAGGPLGGAAGAG